MSATGAGLPDAAHAFLGPERPKPTALTPDLLERSTQIWADPADRVRVGVWAVGTGTFRAVREGYHEAFYVLSGSATLQPDEGPAVDVKAGDAYVTPDGWSGTWKVTEPLRKFYVITTEEP